MDPKSQSHPVQSSPSPRPVNPSGPVSQSVSQSVSQPVTQPASLPSVTHTSPSWGNRAVAAAAAAGAHNGPPRQPTFPVNLPRLDGPATRGTPDNFDCPDLARLGSARLGSARLGPVRLGSARRAKSSVESKRQSLSSSRVCVSDRIGVKRHYRRG